MDKNGTHEEAYKATTACDDEPKSFNDAVNHPDADLWYAAMAEELKTFEKISLYEVIDRPHDRKIIDSKYAPFSSPSASLEARRTIQFSLRSKTGSSLLLLYTSMIN